ncbi:MAG: methyltransferase [Protaetiibacter sp.]
MTTDDLIARLGALPTANIGDAMERFGSAEGLRAIWPGARLAAPAFTVWTRSGDNLAIHQSLEQVVPGQVIVVNGGGDTTRALIGELIGGRARAAGVAGFVIDGAVRDASGLRELGVPVFARGVTPAGPYKNGPSRIGVPIAIGGVVVCPGDIVVGDEDGVVVVPRADATAVLERATKIFDDETDKRAVIERELGL